MRIEGTYTALVTPFRDAPGEPIDWDALDALVDAQIAGGVAGLVPCGTTGESPTLSHEEHAQVIERTVKRGAKGRAQVVAGTGSNSTREADRDVAEHAERAGADAVMVVVPYYNKPTQEGLYRHFVEVAKSVQLPVVVYNIPGRTGADLAPETLARIAEAAPNVVATKEATGNVLRAQKIVQTMGATRTRCSWCRGPQCWPRCSVRSVSRACRRRPQERASCRSTVCVPCASSHAVRPRA